MPHAGVPRCVEFDIMKLNKSEIRKSAMMNLLLVILAALALEATSVVQYYYSQKEIKEEASLRAEGQLENTRIQISDVLDQAEAAVRNNLWIAQWCIAKTDSIFRVTERVVSNNPVVVGSTMAFVPGYYKDSALFSPYTYRDGQTDELKYKTLATQEYDYPNQEWFQKGIAIESGHWSEPYIDKGGGDMLMTTFSMPVKDYSGRTAAVLTADISLGWLTSMFGDVKMYPSAFSMMASRTGKVMVSPAPAFAMYDTIQDIAASMENNEVVDVLSREMLAGESGSKTVRFRGDDYFVYYAPVERTGWSMCIIVPEDEVFGEIRTMAWLIRLLQIVGLLLLVFILRAVTRNQLKLREVSVKKDMMESDLRISRGIQMSMIPKVFPPFPDRKDIDMAGMIIPARDVGGDLYDFYMRDEKLFFCIGDVSGKGVPASLVMAITRSTFRSVSGRETSPAKIVSQMNESMADVNENNMFVTFFCGVLDMVTGKMTYCNAGHNAPLLLSDSVKELPVVPNLPLGIIADMSFQEQETELHCDDALLLYTDGLTEAEDSHHEQFGLKRVFGVLHEHRTATEHLETMRKVVNDFVGKAPQSDDLTMLLIHYLGDGSEQVSCRHLEMNNDIRQIPRLEAFVADIAVRRSLDPGLVASINLAIEEAVTNVIMYAYPKGTEGTVSIDSKDSPGLLEFTITDSGMEFDPTSAPKPDTSLDVEQRRVGGLGIHLVRSIMDSVTYQRKGGRNILKMTKKI